MNNFIKKYEKKVMGILSGFDRVVLRGTLRMLSFEMGMLNFLQRGGVLLKEFGNYVETETKKLKEGTYRKALELGRPIEYLSSCKTAKEPRAREIAEKDGIKSGLICVLKCVEPCVSYKIQGNQETKMLEIKKKYGRCLHVYHYWIDETFGFMSAKIQTWFPFNIQICINGREYLAKTMEKENVFNVREENCFTYIHDFAKAQELMNSIETISWPKHLEAIVERLNPLHKEMFGRENLEYYWSVYQSEVATDIVFETCRDLDEIYPQLMRGAISNFSSSDIMNFLGRTLNAPFKGQLNTDLRNVYQGSRIKHKVNGNSVKAYNKKSNILRVETTINNPKDLKVFRTKEG